MDFAALVISLVVVAVGFVILSFVVKLAVRNAVLELFYGRGETPYQVNDALKAVIVEAIREAGETKTESPAP